MTTPEGFDPRTTAWQIDESEFYELQSFREQVVFMLRYAVLAPSSHNTQPWMFRVTETGVEVFADYSQRPSIIDPDDRELVMSVGAAITNLRVAAAWFGFETAVTYQSRPEQSVPVATVSIRETCLPDSKMVRLFPAIRRRHTNRSAFKSAAIAPDAVAALCDVIDAYPETLHVLGQQHHAAVSQLVAEADRQLMARPAIRAELAEHLRTSEGREGDGLCTDAVRLNAPLSVASWVVRNMNLGDVQAERDRERIDNSAVMVVVTADDDRASLVQAGEILERFLLTVALNSLQYTFVNQPAEVPELRKRLQSLALTPRMPQLMVCVGVASEPVRPAPRRPVNAVVIK